MALLQSNPIRHKGLHPLHEHVMAVGDGRERRDRYTQQRYCTAGPVSSCFGASHAGAQERRGEVSVGSAGVTILSQVKVKVKIEMTKTAVTSCNFNFCT
jgi:hypothetical protein